MTEQSPKSIKLIKFTAAWCNPCKAMQPTIEAVLKEHPYIDFAPCDVDSPEGEKLADAHKIKSMPTLVFLSLDGKQEVGRCYWEDKLGIEKVLANALAKLGIVVPISLAGLVKAPKKKKPIKKRTKKAAKAVKKARS